MSALMMAEAWNRRVGSKRGKLLLLTLADNAMDSGEGRLTNWELAGARSELCPGNLRSTLGYLRERGLLSYDGKADGEPLYYKLNLGGLPVLNGGSQ